MKGFLGQCHAPNSVRSEKPHDRIQVWIGDTNYNYSLECDKEEIAKHCLQMHFENSKETVSEEEIASVYSQLEIAEAEIAAETEAEKTPAKKAAKKKSAKKKSVKKTK